LYEVVKTDDKIVIRNPEIYEPIATVYHSSSYPYGKAYQIAQLFAIAPELYEVLSEIVADYDDLDARKVTQQSINKAKKILDKAK
jgi:hypothetical protein